MEHVGPSRTALRVALRRAAHQVVDSAPRVLDDPFAVRILGPEYAVDLARTPVRDDRPHSVSLRAFLVARSRFAEDTLAEVVAGGVTQYVLLGAGLDTFALRCPHSHVRVFEVDHPRTQQWKRELLHKAGLTLPPAASYVPIDFEHDSLEACLDAAGFDRRSPALFAWLGVVPYLTLAACRATLTFIAALPPGSGVVLDYSQPRSALPPLERLAHDSLSTRVAQAGEPFQSFFTPSQMRGELAAFSQVDDLGREEINARYFDGRGDGLRLLGSAGRIVWATV